MSEVPLDDQIQVVVSDRSVIVHDGRTYGEGDTLELPLNDVRTLEEHGTVTRLPHPPRRES